MKQAEAIGNTLYVIADYGSAVKAWILAEKEHNQLVVTFLGAPRLASQLAEMINEAYPEREEDDKP